MYVCMYVFNDRERTDCPKKTTLILPTSHKAVQDKIYSGAKGHCSALRATAFSSGFGAFAPLTSEVTEAKLLAPSLSEKSLLSRDL